MLRQLVLAVDTTTVRLGLLVLVPAMSFAGSFFGLLKMIPESRGQVVDYQLKVIDSLRLELTRMAEVNARLELRVEQLEASS